MEDFAMYILNEKDYIQKMIIAYYMAKKTGIYFDKSIVLRAEIARLFMNFVDLGVNKNQVITAVLLCNCKKIDNSQKLGKLETYAKEGAEYLASLGFDKDFCNICEGLNRYSGIKRRKKESDILELVDQFSGLILKRAERDAFTPEEAMIILKERNLKNANNRYLEDFSIFVNAMERINIRDVVDVPVLKKLAFLAEREKDAKSYIARLGNKYCKEIDKLMRTELKREAEKFLYSNIEESENVVNLEATKKIQSANTLTEETETEQTLSNISEITKTTPTENNVRKATKTAPVEDNVRKTTKKAPVEDNVRKATKTAQNAKNKIQIVHRYTRKMIKHNPNRALFSKEATERIMNHDTSYRFD